MHLPDASWVVDSLRPERSHPVGDAALSALAFSIERRRLERGRRLYRRGTTPDGVWVIRSGAIELSIRVADTRAVVQILRPGDIAGDIPVILRTASMLTAHVREPGAFLFLSAPQVRSTLAGHADLCFLWMQNVAVRLQDTRKRILELLGNDLAQSVARLILDEEVDGRVPLAQLAIAQMLGAQRTSVNRVLRSFHDDGYVELSYGTVTVKRRDALEDIALLTHAPPDAHTASLS